MVITAQRQGETVRDYACRIIKENIVTMELKPGSLVSETELAKELGVSRTPVREALIQLGKNGMVETFPQRGTKVSLIDTDSVNESRFYRLVIEKALVQEICNNCNEDDLFPLNENLHKQLFCLETKILNDSLTLSVSINDTLVPLCGKVSTIPFLPSCIKASLTGVRLTPSSFASSVSLTRLPGFNSIVTIFSLIIRQA